MALLSFIEMNKKLIYLVILLVYCLNPLRAQSSGKKDPLYWKNRMPYPGYFQQDVHYSIDAQLDDVTDIIDGREELEYTNNSPDTLREVYFHLYQNAFQPGSYLDQLYHANDEYPEYGKYEKEKLGTAITQFRIEGEDIAYQVDNTILRARLKFGLLPGRKIHFTINFKSYFDNGAVRRRMKLFMHDGVKHYDGVHWYPRIAVYDKKFGWETDQHLNREFYGDFGVYDVNLRLPMHYVLDATGVLQNPEETMPVSLREKLDIKNFQIKSDSLSIITPATKETKTWKFHAENVHDFAWTADPSYRIGEYDWEGIKCIALVQEKNAWQWQKTPKFIGKVIETYSRDFGRYVWPKIIVADARDGMEYPMLTLCGGGDPENHSVIAHEVGHEWFYGMVGNNETYRAFLDEGFTQFLTVWAQDKIDGKQNQHTGRFQFQKKFADGPSRIETYNIAPYANSAYGGSDININTHSDGFNSGLNHGGGYGQVYYKGASLLQNLRYILGDSLFLHSMQSYFQTWKLAHPYPEDFRNSVIHATHTDLNQFFDAFMTTSKTIDYAVKSVEKEDSAGKYAVTFKREGSISMPLSFTAYLKDGTSKTYTIPNTYFLKPDVSIKLPRWYGWDRLNQTYTAHISTGQRIKEIRIDTSQLMTDINLLNNSSRSSIRFRLDPLYNPSYSRSIYKVYIRPDVWYNGLDGIKAGIHFRGNYIQRRKNLEGSIWVNTSLAHQYGFQNTNGYVPVNFNLLWDDRLMKLSKDLSYSVNARLLDGLYLLKSELKRSYNGYELSLGFKGFVRPNPARPGVPYLSK